MLGLASASNEAVRPWLIVIGGGRNFPPEHRRSRCRSYGTHLYYNFNVSVIIASTFASLSDETKL